MTRKLHTLAKGETLNLTQTALVLSGWIWGTRENDYADYIGREGDTLLATKKAPYLVEALEDTVLFLPNTETATTLAAQHLSKNPC